MSRLVQDDGHTIVNDEEIGQEDFEKLVMNGASFFRCTFKGITTLREMPGAHTKQQFFSCHFDEGSAVQCRHFFYSSWVGCYFEQKSPHPFLDVPVVGVSSL